jgi:3-dehydroquinate synthase
VDHVEAFDLSFRPAPRRICRVRVGAGALDALVDDLAQEPPGRLLVVVSDEQVGPLHAGRLTERLAARGLRVESLTLPLGESHKTRETKAWVEDRLFDLGAGRDSALIAVGGGLVGDVAGFAAATWHRGVPVVQVPTSLLAMVDAAVGGKTGVNLPGGKNLVGSFHQPWGVYADTAVLSTLPERDYTDGFAEVVKSAVIADGPFFGWLERSVDRLRGREPEALDHAVLRCVQIKARVVRRDEREAGRRAVLNFGHTVAHALEAATAYGIRHAQAVSIGLCVESHLAQRETGFPAKHVGRVEGLLAALGLPVRCASSPTAEAVVEAARRDKKNRDGQIHCALPLRLGHMPPGGGVTVAVAESRLAEAIRASADPRADC